MTHQLVPPRALRAARWVSINSQSPPKLCDWGPHNDLVGNPIQSCGGLFEMVLRAPTGSTGWYWDFQVWHGHVEASSAQGLPLKTWWFPENGVGWPMMTHRVVHQDFRLWAVGWSEVPSSLQHDRFEQFVGSKAIAIDAAQFSPWKKLLCVKPCNYGEHPWTTKLVLVGMLIYPFLGLLAMTRSQLTFNIIYHTYIC